VNVNTVKNTAMLQVLGLLIYLKMQWGGFGPKKRTLYNENAYKAYLAMQPMLKNMGRFKICIKVAVLCAIAVIITVVTPWTRETSASSCFSGIGVLSTVAGILFYRNAIRERVDSDTVELGESFQRFTSGILNTFIERLDTALRERTLLEVSASPEKYAHVVYEVAAQLVHILVLNQIQDEAHSKAGSARIRQERLWVFLDKLAMIGAWPDPQDSLQRGAMLGKLYAWGKCEYQVGQQAPFELPILPLQFE
jgi:hypothetical protein